VSESLAHVEYGKIFLKSFRNELIRTRDEALAESAPILRREVESSIRTRWFDTGATLESLEDEVIDEGERKTYRLSPTTFYAIFGEYGTGRRGERTGEPAPIGYRYGPSEGMDARRFSRIAVGVARSQVEDVWRLKVKELAASLTG
jgi:hypothetical protein